MEVIALYQRLIWTSGAYLHAGGRLALAQDHRHGLAAGVLIDVDRQEAALVVMRVEQRQLLMAVHGIEGVIDVEGDRGRRAAVALAANWSTMAAIARAISIFEGAFSSRDIVGCEHRGSGEQQ